MFNESRSPPTGSSSSVRAWTAAAERPHSPVERHAHDEDGPQPGPESALANHISHAHKHHNVLIGGRRPNGRRSDSLSSHGTAAYDPWGSSGGGPASIAPFAAGGAFVSSPSSPSIAGTSTGAGRSGGDHQQRNLFAGAVSETGWSSSTGGGGGSSTVDERAHLGQPSASMYATPVFFSSLKPPSGLPNMPGAAMSATLSALPSSASANWTGVGSSSLSHMPAGPEISMNHNLDESAPLPTVRLSSSPTSDSTNVVVQLFTQYTTYIISTPPAGLARLADNAVVQHHADTGRAIEVERRYSDWTWLADILVKRYPFRCLPSLPPKRVTVPLPGPHLSTDNTFLEQRRQGLQRYVRALFCHPVLSKDDLVIVFLTEAQTLSHWRSSRDPPLCPEEAYSHPLTEVEEMSIPSDLLPAKIQRTRVVLVNLIDRWRSLSALFERLIRRRETEGADWKRVSNLLGDLASLEGRRWRPELVGGGAGAGTLGRAYKRRNERQRASMFASSSGPFGTLSAAEAAGSSARRRQVVRHSSFLSSGVPEPAASDDGRVGDFVGTSHEPGAGGPHHGGVGDISFETDGVFADNKNATSAEETFRKVARACGDWSEGMKARSTNALASTLEDIKFQRDLWSSFRDMLHRWDKLGPDNVDTIKRRIEQNQHRLYTLVPSSRPNSSRDANNSSVSTIAEAPHPAPEAAVPSTLTAHEQEQVKTLRTALANDAQLVSQLLARRVHTQWVLWHELRYLHEASAEATRRIWKRWTAEERTFVMEQFGAGLLALEMLLAEL